MNFLSSPAESHANAAGPHDRIVMSSRVRLARNLRTCRFPGLGQEAGARQALERHPPGGRETARK